MQCLRALRYTMVRHLGAILTMLGHLGATLKHLVGFENGDFTLEVLTKMTLCAIVCCRVVVCGVVCSCELLLVVCNLRCSKTICLQCLGSL